MAQTDRLIKAIIATFFFILLLTNSGLCEEKKIPDPDKADYLTGTIDRLAEDEIVIDDCLYKYSEGLVFLSRQGAKIAIRWFKKGEKIKFSLNNQNRVQIIRKR